MSNLNVFAQAKIFRYTHLEFGKELLYCGGLPRKAKLYGYQKGYKMAPKLVFHNYIQTDQIPVIELMD